MILKGNCGIAVVFYSCLLFACFLFFSPLWILPESLFGILVKSNSSDVRHRLTPNGALPFFVWTKEGHLANFLDLQSFLFKDNRNVYVIEPCDH